jgi:hypothetical protein
VTQGRDHARCLNPPACQMRRHGGPAGCASTQGLRNPPAIVTSPQ